MGVKSLWTLLEPCGRRISVEALRNQRLAVDASGWLYQFLKAMRDSQGELIRNAHLLGFFRRICKLLFHRILPVFVFDGTAPVLKRSTAIARQRRREQQTIRVRKAAEKLLLNQLKQHALQQTTTLAMDQLIEEEQECIDISAIEKDSFLLSQDNKAVMTRENWESDAIQAAQLESSSNSDDLEPILPEDTGDLNADVMATLPPSLQLELMLKARERQTVANREHFESYAAKPESFSNFQLQQYLKASNLRRRLNSIKDQMNAAAGVGGARRLAADAEREYVLHQDGVDVQMLEEPSEQQYEKSVLQKSPVKPGVLKVSFEINNNELEGIEEAEEFEWEDVEEEKLTPQSQQQTQHWRERAAQRQKYWSLSHGFQMGRKLGEWGDSEEKKPPPKPVSIAEEDEDAQLQEAIRRSLFNKETEGILKMTGCDKGENVTADADDVGEIILKLAASAHQQFQTQASDVAAIINEQSAVRLESLLNGNVSEMLASVAAEKQTQVVATGNLRSVKSIPDGVQADVTDVSHHHSLIEQEEGLERCRGLAAGEEMRSHAPTPAPPLALPILSSSEPVNSEEAIDIVNLAGDDSRRSAQDEREDLNVVHHHKEKKKNKSLSGSPIDEAIKGIQNPNTTNIVGIPSELKTTKSPGLRKGIQQEMEFPSMSSLREEESILKTTMRAAKGAADAPTSEMYQEVQELLTLFGIPFIIAPSEAEAQCAWLDVNGLVDGVITDDNDAFLFGAKRVLRNIFDGKKYVEEYRSSDIDSELGLDREKLIYLALLLGSDYTEGVAGVGIVNAVEVVHAFSGQCGLKHFKGWLEGPDEQILSLAGMTSNTQEPDGTAYQKEFKKKHQGVRKNWELPAGFPSEAVIEAYKRPRLDLNKEKFTFGRPDLEMLREFCMAHFGWQASKSDELLLPVVKAFDDRTTQTTLDSFLVAKQRFAKIKSKRLQKAVAGIAGIEKEEIMLREDGPSIAGGERKKRNLNDRAKPEAPIEKKKRKPGPKRKKV